MTEIGKGEVAGELAAGTEGEPAGSEELGNPAGDDSGETLEGTSGVEVFPPEAPVSVAVTGQIVVESAIVEVTTTVESAGQSVIDAAQLVIVTSRVV